MFAQIVKFRVKPAKIEAFLDAFKQNYIGTRQEQGNLRFELLRSQSDPTHFVAYEVFADADALDIHRQSNHFEACVGQFGAVLESDRTMEPFTPVIADYLVEGD